MGSWPAARQEFIAICKRAFRLGMQVSTGGNISVRLDQKSFLVKPSGLSLYDLREDHLLIVDPSGRVIKGQGRPTKEIGFHLAIYGVRDDIGAVVHYHPPYATSFAVSGWEIPLRTVHAKRILGRVPIIPQAPEGSETLAKSLKEAFGQPDVRAVLMSCHGIVAAGKGLREAENIAELLEETAKIAFLSTLLNKNPWQDLSPTRGSTETPNDLQPS